VLRSLGIINADTKLAGVSGGAITSAAACQNMPLASEYDINIKTLKLCRSKNNCKGTLESELRSALITPDAIGSAQKCKGRLHVAVTAAKKNPETDTGLLLGPNWSDDIQVLNALTTSAYLSHFAGEAAVTDALKDDGIPEAYDGYYTSAIPTPPGGNGWFISYISNADMAWTAMRMWFPELAVTASHNYCTAHEP